MVHQLSSSLRARPIEETLRHARVLAREVGISRVTDTTRLDRLGVPVYAAIRPDAMAGSLCVSAGKGLLPAEAEIGAYMEGIELAYAEPRRSTLSRVQGTLRDVLDARTRGAEALVDLCPYLGARLDLDLPIELAPATDIFTGERLLVPLERVLMPVRPSIYGSDSNGLSSGNDILEATVHGLGELVERDIEAFLSKRDRSIWVRSETLPEPILRIAATAEAQGVALHVRHYAREYRLPFFIAVLLERKVRDGMWVGMGCHPVSTIAAVRAVTEAFQSRLTVIHGGRDDLGPHMEKFTRLSDRERDRIQELVAERSGPGRETIAFQDVVDRAAEIQSLEDALSLLEKEVRGQGLSRFLRVVLTPPDAPLAVVRMIVPGLEFCHHGGRNRAGRRLLAALTGPH